MRGEPMAFVPCGLEAFTTDLIGPVSLTRDPLPEKPGFECKKSHMDQARHVFKSALSERPRIKAMSAAVLSMNQSPLRPRNIDGRANNAYRTWRSSSWAIFLSPGSQKWYTRGGMTETNASRCWLWPSCHTTKKPPVPCPEFSNAASEAARKRGPVYGKISMILEGLVAMMVRNKLKQLRNSSVNSEVRSCCLRLIGANPPQPMRPQTPSSEKLATP